MKIEINKPVAFHHEASPWPQRSATLLCVVGLHVVVGAALMALQLHAPETVKPPVLTVHWLPTEKPAPPQPQQAKEPPPKKQTPAPVQKTRDIPQVKPMETLLVQAPATTASTAEAPQAAPAPPAPAAFATAPSQVALAVAPPAPPIAIDLNPAVDCTQRPKPIYPDASLKLAEEGTVMLRLQVDERGNPLRVEIESSSKYGRLDRAARDIVATSYVCPMRQGKQGFAGWLRVPIKFELPTL